MNESLAEKIKKFQAKKKILVPLLLVLGLVGIVLPVIPGLALLFFAFLLLFPKLGPNLESRIARFKD